MDRIAQAIKWTKAAIAHAERTHSGNVAHKKGNILVLLGGILGELEKVNNGTSTNLR